jgi:hypothetical protein
VRQRPSPVIKGGRGGGGGRGRGDSGPAVGGGVARCRAGPEVQPSSEEHEKAAVNGHNEYVADSGTGPITAHGGPKISSHICM